VVLFGGRAQQFGEEGLQRIRPHLVTLHGGMQFVAHHAIEQPPIATCELIVNVQISDPPAIGKPGEMPVDLID
jgi:hypothetical protein